MNNNKLTLVLLLIFLPLFTILGFKKLNSPQKENIYQAKPNNVSVNIKTGKLNNKLFQIEEMLRLVKSYKLEDKVSKINSLLEKAKKLNETDLENLNLENNKDFQESSYLILKLVNQKRIIKFNDNKEINKIKQYLENLEKIQFEKFNDNNSSKIDSYLNDNKNLNLDEDLLDSLNSHD
jgi:hypothetical protein